MASLSATLMVIRKDVASNKKPYAVVDPDNGGSFCIWPKVGDQAASKIVESLPVGKLITLDNVGLFNGLTVYGNTKVTIA